MFYKIKKKNWKLSINTIIFFNYFQTLVRKTRFVNAWFREY